MVALQKKVPLNIRYKKTLHGDVFLKAKDYSWRNLVTLALKNICDKCICKPLSAMLWKTTTKNSFISLGYNDLDWNTNEVCWFATYRFYKPKLSLVLISSLLRISSSFKSGCMLIFLFRVLVWHSSRRWPTTAWTGASSTTASSCHVDQRLAMKPFS